MEESSVEALPTKAALLAFPVQTPKKIPFHRLEEVVQFLPIGHDAEILVVASEFGRRDIPDRLNR